MGETGAQKALFASLKVEAQMLHGEARTERAAGHTALCAMLPREGERFETSNQSRLVTRRGIAYLSRLGRQHREHHSPGRATEPTPRQSRGQVSVVVIPVAHAVGREFPVDYQPLLVRLDPMVR